MFFFNDTATTEIYTLSLHDALPIFGKNRQIHTLARRRPRVHLLEERADGARIRRRSDRRRSEEHTSELQSHSDLVCRLLLEKKKTQHPSWSPTDKSCEAGPSAQDQG